MNEGTAYAPPSALEQFLQQSHLILEHWQQADLTATMASQTSHSIHFLKPCILIFTPTWRVIRCPYIVSVKRNCFKAMSQSVYGDQ